MASTVAALVAAFLLVLPARGAAAQAAAAGVLRVTVLDESGAILVGASVTLTGLDDATRAVSIPPVQTTAEGVAIIPKLLPGRYAVEAAFAGFATRRLPDVRVRNGDNRQVLLLPIEAIKDTVVVEQDRQSAAVDPRGPSFGTTLTREQLDALSDDPEVLRQQLQEMAGPGAVIKVDSFEGGALPPKAQIRSIRISRDQFAAENHSAGGTQIEIITQPGLGPLRFMSGVRMRGSGLGGRSPFTPRRGPERNRNYFFGTSGTLVKDKSSFNVFVTVADSYDTPNINVALVGGTRSEALALRTPRENVRVNAQLDHALTLDQTLRFALNVNRNRDRNLGIGAYDEEERAYANDAHTSSIRAQHMGPLGRRAFTRSRVQFAWTDSDMRAAVEMPTIRVNDAFTRGGAQVDGGQHSRTLGIGSDLDYVRGAHTVRTGMQLDVARWRSDDTSNYLGTYTFESLDAFLEGRPRSYTRRLGDPTIRYDSVQAAVYVQDDVRVRRSLTLSAGLRYEVQTHVSNGNNLAPRIGATWSPRADGRTTLRSSWGLFYDWMATNTYEQTLRVDGLRQRELNILDPPYPDPSQIVGGVAPINRYLLGDGFRLPRSNRVSLGVDQRLTSLVTATATYSYTRGAALARGLNLNAPVGGARPDPRVGNIVEVVSDAESRLHQLQLNLTANPGALLPAFNAPLISWKRTTVFANFTLASLKSNTEGAFAIPPLGSLGDEWGPSGDDVRHRVNVAVNNQIVRNLLVAVNVTASGGTPYTILSGRDGNSDLLFNDRPAGVARNTERAAAQWTLNMFTGYAIALGKPVSGPPGVTVIGGGGVASVQNFQQPPRYVVQLFVQGQNLTNHPNYVGYSGMLTSPFFGRPTGVVGTRKIDVGINFMF